jgi:flavin-dependent dehydrogenase
MIIGAGIVGTYLGSLMGDVKIFESSEKLREKSCSGLLSASGLKALKLPYEDTLVNEVKGARMTAGEHSLLIKKRTTQAYVLDRFKLQENTMQMALDNKCEIEWGKKWKGEKEGFIIGADGALSTVAATMSIKRDYIYTYQIRAKCKVEDEEIVYLHFSKEYAPGFFAWIIPEGNGICRIGMGMNKGNAKENFDTFVKKENIQFSGEKDVQGGIIPIYDGKRIIEGNKALIGDAAAQVKATTGGGIIFGCKAAHLLKDSIDKNNLNHYQNEFKRKYIKDLIVHKKIRRMMDRADNEAVMKKLLDNDIQGLIEKYGDMDHPRTLVRHVLMKPKLWGMARHFL